MLCLSEFGLGGGGKLSVLEVNLSENFLGDCKVWVASFLDERDTTFVFSSEEFTVVVCKNNKQSYARAHCV